MLLNFKILAFFWRQFYQEKRKRIMKSSSFDRLFGFSPTTTKRYVAFWGLKLGNSLLSYHNEELRSFLGFKAGELIALLPRRSA